MEKERLLLLLQVIWCLHFKPLLYILSLVDVS